MDSGFTELWNKAGLSCLKDTRVNKQVYMIKQQLNSHSKNTITHGMSIAN